jgi:hypothetical protein
MQFVGSGAPPKIGPMILFHWFCCFVNRLFEALTDETNLFC